MTTENGKRNTKRPTREQFFKLGKFCVTLAEDIKIGKYTARELAAMSYAELKTFEFTPNHVKEACRLFEIEFKSRVPTSSGRHHRDRRPLHELVSQLDVVPLLAERVFLLEMKVATLMHQLGVSG